MTHTEFLKIKLTAKKPQFKELIGLTQVDTNCSFLIEFATLSHPNQSKEGQGAKVTVYTDKAQHNYTLYQGFILKTTRLNKFCAQATQTIYKY